MSVPQTLSPLAAIWRAICIPTAPSPTTPVLTTVDSNIAFPLCFASQGAETIKSGAEPIEQHATGTPHHSQDFRSRGLGDVQTEEPLHDLRCRDVSLRRRRPAKTRTDHRSVRRDSKRSTRSSQQP